jgi:hypothetical protein
MLSPLNEFDEELDNPLNKAMIVESTATGFHWSKTRNATAIDAKLSNIDDCQEPKQPPAGEDFKLREQLEAMNHSF